MLKINFLPNPINQSPHASNKKQGVYATWPFAPIPRDTVSFGAIKKSSLKGFDLACAEMFQAPVEKFNSNEDFKKWAQQKLNGYFDIKYEGKNQDATEERIRALKQWKDYLQEENNIYIKDPALSLIIFSSITKDLNKKNDYLPPVLNKAVLSQTAGQIAGQIEEKSKKNKKYQFNFSELYKDNLKLYYMQGEGEISTSNAPLNGWIKIPSKTNDPENFDKNVEKLKAMSYKSWCTKHSHAETYLSKGDFHIYFDNNKPKIGIKFEKDKIDEIQGENNNSIIPLDYLDVAKDYINENKYKGAESQIKKTEEFKQGVEKIKDDLKESIKNKDSKAILEYLGYKPTVLEDNTLEISNYKQPDEDYTFAYLGIDENDLFKNISKITNKADFSHSKITDLGNIKSIGWADFSYSQIKDLGNLTSIGFNADFRHSQITDLGKLTSIGFNADFSHSQITDLGNLTSIGNCAKFSHSLITDLGKLKSLTMADFSHSLITDLGKLTSIGRADFSHSLIKDLGNLTSIDGSAKFSHSLITNLGKLKSIGKDADFRHSQITNLGKLESIGGSANFENSQITNLGKLKSIGEYAWFKESQITDLGNLTSIGNDADFSHSKVTNLGNLTSIGGSAKFSHSLITNLGKLKSIGKDAKFSRSQITNLGKLESIGDCADFSDSLITDLGELKSIGQSADFRNSQIIYLGKLKSIGWHLYCKNSKITDWSGVKIKGIIIKD